MINPTASTAISSLALNTGILAVTGDGAAVSADFAALLGTTIGPGGEGAANPFAQIGQAAGLQVRQPTGNLAGKALPVDPFLASANAATAGFDAPQGAESTPALAVPAATPEIILPGLTVPASAAAPLTAPTAPSPQTAQTPPLAAPSTTDSLVKTAAAQLAAPVLTAKAEAGPIAKPIKGGKAEKPATGEAETALSAISTETPVATATTFVAALLTDAVVTPAPVIEGANPLTPPVAAAPIPATAPPLTDTAALEPQQTAAIAQWTAAPVIARPAGAAQPDAAKPAIKASETADSQPKAVAAPASEVTIAMATQRADGVQEAAKARDPLTPATSEAPASKISTPAQPLTAPVLAMPDAQTFSQTVGQVVTAPAANSPAQTGHDFNALVDRLVEAREAAMPAAVHAAVTHREFGNISLRFDQDAGGLSVAMSSADPEFANAVQASAASAQSQTTSDNGSNAARQDTGAQQYSSGANTGQPQSQGQSQASARQDRSEQARADTRSPGATAHDRQDDEAADMRGGIYA